MYNVAVGRTKLFERRSNRDEDTRIESDFSPVQYALGRQRSGRRDGITWTNYFGVNSLAIVSEQVKTHLLGEPEACHG